MNSGDASSSPTTQVTLRRATEADVPSIAEIYNEAVRTTVATFDTEPRSLDAQREWLHHHDPGHPVLVADRQGHVVGWASLSPWSDRRAYDGTAEVSFYVRSEERGRGIGRHLLEGIVSTGQELQLHALLSRIADGNSVSVHLHESLGFRPVGVMREVGFKFGRWIDVHLFQRMLP
ncbi:MAG: N-acetyltransferase family protein [Thermoplasmata archaeon]|jgi:L-amino acid N-acyltransferase YncA|nr:N-acetyltransferase family protein [Thermoplasmata archaeon]